MASNERFLAFEIGTEEIPAFDLAKATDQLPGLAAAIFEELKIPHGAIEVLSTPRRLVLLIEGVACSTQALVEEYKGPSAAIAFDDEGNPTKAASGFARGKGLDVTDLELREIDGASYVYAVRNVEARPVNDLLPAALLKVIESISWPKTCRWGTQSAYFSRPVRWLVGLFGEEAIPVEFAGLTADRMTYGHRFLAPGPHRVECAEKLRETIEAAFVIPTQALREKAIRAGVEAAEHETGFRAELPAKTLTEVINLTEYPTVLVGTFDAEYLQVPEEIIVDAMLMHQRYFPLYDDQGKLTNRFLVVSNGDPACSATIIDGNERVVRARLSDAQFFYTEDLRVPLEGYVERLDEVVFQETLGSMLDKTNRIVAVVGSLCDDAGFSAEAKDDALRAAYLCKADLVTNAVVEFTSVQGVMGSYYALASGENEIVAQTIADHYRPRFSGDEPPATDVGKAVAMADKLDTICGLFAVGQGPTGSSDPFALRRGAIGIINMLNAGMRVSLGKAIEAALDAYDGIAFDRAAAEFEIREFFVTRTKVMLRDGGADVDAIDAVLAAGVVEPVDIIERVGALLAVRREMTEVMEDLSVAYARANNLRDASLGLVCDVSLMNESELALSSALEQVEAKVEAALASNDYTSALQSLAELRQPIDRFFEDVLIMDEDRSLKENRLRLLNRYVAAFAHVADFGKMAKTGS